MVARAWAPFFDMKLPVDIIMPLDRSKAVKSAVDRGMADIQDIEMPFAQLYCTNTQSIVAGKENLLKAIRGGVRG